MATVVTLDFETYYNKQYSLREMPTAQYINDPRFQIIGVAASVNGSEPEWYSCDNIIGYRAFLDKFNLGEHGTMTVAHNAMFDGAILEWVLGIKPWRYFCTMMGARPYIVPHTGSMSLKAVADYLGFGAKGTAVTLVSGMRLGDFSPLVLDGYAEYCRQDVRLTWEVFAKLFPMFPRSELRLIDLTIKKFTKPQLQLDAKVIDGALKEEKANKQKALAATGLADPSELMSNPKFAKLLQNYGVDPPKKVSPTTGQETWAFAKSDLPFRRLLDSENETVRNLVHARLTHKSTINETRLDKFLAVARSSRDHSLAVPLLYYGAHPGRFSGLDKLNLQNLGRGSALRRAIIAPPGHKVVAGDLSQIEARITATLAGQKDLVKLFRYYDQIEGSDRDVYCEFGDKVYGERITKAHERQRFVAKTGVLSLGYQSGAQKFLDSMRGFGLGANVFSHEDAVAVVQTYRTNFSRIVQLWQTMEHIKDCMVSGQGFELGPITVLLGQILLPNGMRLSYPELTPYGRNYRYKFGREWRDIYGGKLTENVVQALARIVMTTAELRLAKAGVRAALSVHDELVYVIPEAQVDNFVKALHMALTATVPWMPELPVNCEIGVGDNYADAK